MKPCEAFLYEWLFSLEGDNDVSLTLQKNFAKTDSNEVTAAHDHYVSGLNSTVNLAFTSSSQLPKSGVIVAKIYEPGVIYDDTNSFKAEIEASAMKYLNKSSLIETSGKIIRYDEVSEVEMRRTNGYLTNGDNVETEIITRRERRHSDDGKNHIVLALFLRILYVALVLFANKRHLIITAR
jgi:hypothetical protein